jgi:DNA polymerase III subunit epsilon
MDLFFDVETTGLPPFRGCPVHHPEMPHLVQFAAILADDEREYASVSVMIKPDGWVIDDTIAELTGITNEMASMGGITEWSVAMMFVSLARKATRLIAHNLPFDVLMMGAALHRAAKKNSHIKMPSIEDLLDQSIEAVCTMRMSSPIVNLPPTEKMVAAGMNMPKSPKLSEAYEFFTGEPLIGAHDALVDVRACRQVFQQIQKIAA